MCAILRDTIKYMWKERSFVILVLFLLFQIPLIFLCKKDPFEEKKWLIAVGETCLIGCSLFLLMRRRTVSKPEFPKESVSRSTLNEKGSVVAEKPKETEAFSLLQEELRLLKEEKEIMSQELHAAKQSAHRLERELSDLQRSHSLLIEEKEALRTAKVDREENVELFQDLIRKMKGALFAEIEAQQEMRRLHMIEVRALLRKESAPLLKEGSPLPDRKTLVPSVPRGTSDPFLLLLLVSVFSERLRAIHEHDQNAHFLVRRKFFEELKALRSSSLMCLSLDMPAESVIPQPHYQSEEAQRLLEWIRQRVGLSPWEGGSSPLLAVPPSGKERWLVVRLDKPFFHDLFLCANQPNP